MGNSVTPLFEYLAKGGPVMIPIAFCSILALAIIIERLIVLRRNQFLPNDLLEDIRSGLLRNQAPEVMAICYRSEMALARLVKAGIEHLEDGREEMQTAMESVGKQEVVKMEHHLAVLGNIAAISPLLGLLGTVTGMIRTFGVITVEGIGNPQALSGGISEALITTAAGLIVGIPALAAHAYLVRRAGILTSDLESIAAEMLNLLSKQGRVRAR